MYLMSTATSILLSFAITQAANAALPVQLLPPKTTLPIIFTGSVDAKNAHVGDLVLAKTIQNVDLPGGARLPAGSKVIGHVVGSTAFAFDRRAYARQKQARLSIHFDEVSTGKTSFALNVYVRAIADPISAWDAEMPTPNSYDSAPETNQIGGDIVRRSMDEVVSNNGDVVGYRRHADVYAHLISAVGNAPNACDGSDTEQAMGAFSASACGLYGFAGSELLKTAAGVETSTMTLVSTRQTPRIWKHSTALLEVIAPNAGTAPR
jgi:hypothetical protein